MNGEKKILVETYFGEKKIPAKSNAEKKKSYSKEIAHPTPSPPFPPPQKLNGPSLNHSETNSRILYDIKSKFPEQYSTVGKVGSEKPFASKSCFV